MNIFLKINRKLLKWYRRYTEWRLQPIRVFLFHQVSDCFDASTMIECDWTTTKQFKTNIEILQKEYKFISLTDAHKMLRRDLFPFCFRVRKYAVLTSDDGWSSLNNILPWLVNRQIPVTLFINPKYADGIAYREKKTEKYLTRDELSKLVSESNGKITIGLHGLEHFRATSMSLDSLRKYVSDSISETESIPGYIPFWAYTWGGYTEATDAILNEFGIVPVYINGQVNKVNINFVDRELLDGQML